MLDVKICMGTNCLYAGAQAIHDKIEIDPLFDGRIHLETVKCFDGVCDEGTHSPVVKIDGKLYFGLSVEQVSEIIYNKLNDEEVS